MSLGREAKSKWLTLREGSFPNFDVRFFDKKEHADSYIKQCMQDGNGAAYDLFELKGRYHFPIEFSPVEEDS